MLDVVDALDRAVFRLWIVRRSPSWKPDGPLDAPPSAVALRAVENPTSPIRSEGRVSAAEASAFIEGYNEKMLATGRLQWAVAVPVHLRFDGEPAPGQRFQPAPLEAGE